MYRIIISSFIVLFATLNLVAQNQKVKNDVAFNNPTPRYHDIATYKLFPTENLWTFIKLNTRNGKMWQVQYDIEGDNRGETFLNIRPLVKEENEVNGRFTLYSTQNFYTFILLDQLSGKMWQVQWSQEFENRLTLPIN